MLSLDTQKPLRISSTMRSVQTSFESRITKKNLLTHCCLLCTDALQARMNTHKTSLRLATCVRGKTWHCPHLLLRPRAATPCCCGAGRAAIDRYHLTIILHLPGPQQQTRCTLLQQANGTYIRTDGRTPHRFIDAAPRRMRAAPKI